MTLLDGQASQATVSAGVFSVRVRCNLTREPCLGALLLCKLGDFCYGHPPPGSPISGGRVAGSDFTVQPRQTASISIGLTGLGERLVSRPGGFRGFLLLTLKDYGRMSPATPGHPNMFFQNVYLRLTPA
jgi:hypothetical protein